MNQVNYRSSSSGPELRAGESGFLGNGFWSSTVKRDVVWRKNPGTLQVSALATDRRASAIPPDLKRTEIKY